MSSSRPWKRKLWSEHDGHVERFVHPTVVLRLLHYDPVNKLSDFFTTVKMIRWIGSRKCIGRVHVHCAADFSFTGVALSIQENKHFCFVCVRVREQVLRRCKSRSKPISCLTLHEMFQNHCFWFIAIAAEWAQRIANRIQWQARCTSWR